MAHLLHPGEGIAYLDPEEVVRRLQGEFDYVSVDREEGSEVVSGIIAKLVELNAPQEIIDTQLAGQSQALQIVIADDPTSDVHLKFTVKPNDGIFIGYFSWDHEQATRPLLERCARVLNYQKGSL